MRLAGMREDLVARGVAQHVVDHLEAVQVDVQHGHAGLRGIVQARFEFLEHRVAVEQHRQRIGARLHAQGLSACLLSVMSCSVPVSRVPSGRRPRTRR
jgi:hypothetical protein